MRALLNPLLLMLLAASATGAEPVALRAEHFVVPPSTGPVTHVLVQNRLDTPYSGTVRLKLPDGWRLNPAERAVSLKPRETKRVPFAIERAVGAEANAYAVEVTATGGGTRVVRTQRVVCASAPYGKPKTDGRLRDWGDAIPITFVAGGKRTVVRALWNKRQFCLAVEVEEDKLIGYSGKPPAGGFDAVQFALAPRETTTGAQPADKAVRCEFLIAASTGLFARDRCFALIRPGASLAVAQKPRGLAPLELKEAKVAVKRRRGVTCYECAIPSSALPGIRLSVGTELCFSLLVHDPDGTGVRDWGEAAGLWPWRRSRLAWCTWQGAQWGGYVPFDGKIEFGLCSSKH